MLTAIENRLLAALAPALPSGVPCVAGPSTGPGTGEDERVELHASRLSITLPEGEDLRATRSDAFLVQVHQLDADGSALDYSLPNGAEGEIIEVESPPGMPLRNGDDYVVAERTVRFYRAPAAGARAVVITLRGGRATGFQERRSSTARVGVHAWAKTAARADELLRAAVRAVMTAAVSPASIELEAVDLQFRLRLLRPALLLEGIERTAEKLGGNVFFKATAHCLVRGELELTVALGAAERPHTIREIIYGQPDIDTGSISR